MKRQIIKIDEKLCDGCGLCVDACHEGAIQLIDGKAVLVRDDYCDGLGNCLPVCPTGAISFEEREALPFDAVAAKENELKKKAKARLDGVNAKMNSSSEGDADEKKPLPCGCPSAHSRRIEKRQEQKEANEKSFFSEVKRVNISRLSQWPIQIKLVPFNAPYFDNARLLIAADCAAYAYANFHEDFIKNHVTIIGCPKLDMVDYSEKLADILRHNNIKSVTVVRMEVPCCGGIEYAVKEALKNSGKMIPWQVHVVGVDGELIEL